MVEYGRKLEEKVKAMKREIKKKHREPTVTGRKSGLKAMIWSRRKKETFNQNKMKKQEFTKLRRGLGTSRTTLNLPTSESYGARRRRGRARN